MINKFSILNGVKYFSSGIFQNYLVFIPAKKYIKYFSGTARIKSWKSNGMSSKKSENITKSESNFDGHCLMKNSISILKKVTNHKY